MASIKSLLTAASLGLLLAAGAAHAQAPNDPAATFLRYLDAVNATDIDKLRDVMSDDMAPFTYSTCPAGMAAKPCFIRFIEETQFARHGVGGGA